MCLIIVVIVELHGYSLKNFNELYSEANKNV